MKAWELLILMAVFGLAIGVAALVIVSHIPVAPGFARYPGVIK
jgi:hypothetical protein